MREAAWNALRCPASRQGLRRMADGELAELNRRIAAGKLFDVAGDPVTQALDAALLRDDADLAYPLTDGIPVLLVERGIPLPKD